MITCHDIKDLDEIRTKADDQQIEKIIEMFVFEKVKRIKRSTVGDLVA